MATPAILFFSTNDSTYIAADKTWPIGTATKSGSGMLNPFFHPKQEFKVIHEFESETFLVSLDPTIPADVTAFKELTNPVVLSISANDMTYSQTVPRATSIGKPIISYSFTFNGRAYFTISYRTEYSEFTSKTICNTDKIKIEAYRVSSGGTLTPTNYGGVHKLTITPIV